jgi:hypothetical protein
MLVPSQKNPYTANMVRALGAALMLVTVTNTARGDELPCPSPVPTPVTVQPASPSPSPTLPSADERAFSAELERFARLRAFTEQLIARREADDFERATLRQARIAKLKRELTEREAAMSEREFDAAVALHLKKRDLTRELTAAAARAKPAPANSTK